MRNTYIPKEKEKRPSSLNLFWNCTIKLKTTIASEARRPGHWKTGQCTVPSRCMSEPN